MWTRTLHDPTKAGAREPAGPPRESCGCVLVDADLWHAVPGWDAARFYNTLLTFENAAGDSRSVRIGAKYQAVVPSAPTPESSEERGDEVVPTSQSAQELAAIPTHRIVIHKRCSTPGCHLPEHHIGNHSAETRHVEKRKRTRPTPPHAKPKEASDSERSRRESVKPRGAQPRACGSALVGKRVSVYWKMMKRWYVGIVTHHHCASGTHGVLYEEDGDFQIESLDRNGVVWRLCE